METISISKSFSFPAPLIMAQGSMAMTHERAIEYWDVLYLYFNSLIFSKRQGKRGEESALIVFLSSSGGFEREYLPPKRPKPPGD